MAQPLFALADSRASAEASAPSLPAIPTPIATDALGRIMVEAVPFQAPMGWGFLTGFVLRKRAIVAGAPMIRESENVYAYLHAAEDAYWADCEAERFSEKRIVEWDPWRPAVELAQAA